VKCASDEKEVAAADEEYETLRKQRVGLQEKIKELVRECNVLIAKENEAAAIRDKSVAQKVQNEEELKRLSISSAQCLSVIKSYNEFMEINGKYIDEMKQNFNGLWKEFEDKWTKWTANDIAIWFRYKTVGMDTSNVDWRKTREELERRNISGKSLRKFSELTFECLDIHDFEVVQHLMSSINELKGKNVPLRTLKVQEIPRDYLCPLTKKVMEDPVMAFDGHCYERKAIEEYLRSEKRSPVTGKEADFAIVFPNHRLRGEIEVFMKGSGGGEGLEGLMSKLLSESKTDEGAPETH